MIYLQAFSFKGKGKPLSNLQELPDLRDRPKHFLSFRNLSILNFVACKQLKFILSASTTRSIPELRDLFISDCEELVSIIEDDEEIQENSLNPHQACFPKLRKIQVKHCKKLQYLFSISTCDKLPRLLMLDIEDAPELVQVFERKQGAPQELVIKDVLPNLLGIRLVNLPSLHTIYQGIDFQTVKIRLVRDCNNIPLTNVSSSELFDFHVSLGQGKMNFVDDDYYYARNIFFSWAHEAVEKDSTIQKQNSSSPSLIENTETSTNEIVEEQLSTSKTAATSSSKSDRDNLVQKVGSSTHSELCEKESKDDQEALREGISLNEDPQRVKEPSNYLFTKETTKKVASAIPRTTTITEMTSPVDPSISTPTKKPQIATSTAHAEPKSSQSDPFDISITTECPQNLEATFEEGPSLEKYDQASPSTYSKPKIEEPYIVTPTELCGKESVNDQEALGESRGSNEAPQRVEEPTNECSSKETSNKMALTIPPSVTGMTFPLISSISSPKKPQIATSATHVEMESGSSASTDQSAQGEIMVNQRETSIDVEHKIDRVNPRRIEEDDLIRLFRIMRDGSDWEVGLPHVSKIAAFEDDKMARAFADVEFSLKMDLNQVANSEEQTHRLENALNFLSTHFSEDGPSSHNGLIRGKIDSLYQEIQRIFSSFKQASDTLDTFTKLKENEKWIDEQHSQREEAAKTLVFEIRNTEDYMIELKEQISRLQAELKSKEKEYEDCEIKLSSLHKQKKECVLDTIGFMEEYEAVKKDRSSYVVDGHQTKARQELKKLENQWLSCVAELRKTALLLGILLKQKP